MPIQLVIPARQCDRTEGQRGQRAARRINRESADGARAAVERVEPQVGAIHRQIIARRSAAALPASIGWETCKQGQRTSRFIDLIAVDFVVAAAGCRAACRRSPNGAEATDVELKVASVFRPQLSVARMVMRWVPAGAALLSEMTPVVLLTLMVAGVSALTLDDDRTDRAVVGCPLSGVIVSPPPAAKV